MSIQKQQVLALLKSIETGDAAAAAVVNPTKYIQHNLTVGDGLEGLGVVLGKLPPGSARVNTVRVFQDGDFVFAHTDYDFFGPKIGFDIFRFEDGRIVEHWDNLQKTAGPNPSGRTMIDGPSDAGDPARTAASKVLVKSFVDDVLVGGQFDKLPTYIAGEDYAQHNPAIGDGLSGLDAAIAAMASMGVTMRYDRVHRVLGEGDFVLTVSEGALGGEHVAFFDLFRVSSGRIVEHWDTIESIPPRAEWENSNGKF
jgi:predicted SnoaL-like aldol condensation-catalyzing enzyme